MMLAMLRHDVTLRTSLFTGLKIKEMKCHENFESHFYTQNLESKVSDCNVDDLTVKFIYKLC